MKPRRLPAIVLFALLSGAALAQTSASFRLEEYTFNAGGTPSQGTAGHATGELRAPRKAPSRWS